MLVLLTVPLGLLWGWVSRMCGGASPKLPFGLDQWIYALPTLLLFPFISWWVIPSYFLDFLSKRLGHGRGISLGNPLTGKPEKVEVVSLWLVGKISDYWYQALVLSLTAFVGVILPAVLLVIYGHYLIAVTVFLSGVVGKPFGYIVGWWVYPEGKGEGIPQMNEATAIGEFLTGVFNKVPNFLFFFLTVAK